MIPLIVPSHQTQTIKLSLIFRYFFFDSKIAYEAPGNNDPDIYALSVLASLLGGGGSFSAGGPGKGSNVVTVGMYTRLYTGVLNRCGWVENCNVVHHSYADSGYLL